MSRAFVGEWIFSHALFDWSAKHAERYLAEVMTETAGVVAAANPTRAREPGDIRAILKARDAASAFIDGAGSDSRGAAADRRSHERVTAEPGVAGARENA